NRKLMRRRRRDTVKRNNIAYRFHVNLPLERSRFLSAMDEPKTGAKRDGSRRPCAATALTDAHPDARQSTRIRDRLARALGVAAVSRETKSRRVHALCRRQHRERVQSSE